MQPNILVEIGDITRQLREEIGLEVLIIEQKLPFARRVGDRFAITDHGSAVASGEMYPLTDDLVARNLTV